MRRGATRSSRGAETRAEAYYDTALGITWLANPLAGAGSELGHLFHVTLGMHGVMDTQGREQDRGAYNAGPFDGFDLGSDLIFGTFERFQRPDGDPGVFSRWGFDFKTGAQNGYANYACGAWAVHDGDVGTPMSLPEPPTAALLGAATALGLARRRAHRPA